MHIVFISIICITGRIEHLQCSEVGQYSYSVSQKKANKFPVNITNSITKTLHYVESSPNFEHDGNLYKFL